MSSRETMASSALVSPDHRGVQPGEGEQHPGGEVDERGGWRDGGPGDRRWRWRRGCRRPGSWRAVRMPGTARLIGARAATAACSAVSTQPIPSPASANGSASRRWLAPVGGEPGVGEPNAATPAASTRGLAAAVAEPAGGDADQRWRRGCRRRRARARAGGVVGAVVGGRAGRWRAGSAGSRRRCRPRTRRCRPSAGRAGRAGRGAPRCGRAALARARAAAVWRMA